MTTFHSKLQPDQESFKKMLSHLTSHRQTQARTNNHRFDKISHCRMSVHNSVLKPQLGRQLKMISLPCVKLRQKSSSK